MWRRTRLGRWALLLMFAMTTDPAAADDTRASAAAQLMAANALIAGTKDAERGELLQPFTDAARSNWHYTPRTRVGLPFKRMNEAQRAAAQGLLAAALSDTGLEKVRAVIALEIALRELESSSIRDAGNYAFAIYGTPREDAPWGWRIEGHHLSLHFTIDRSRVASSLPQFVGANPAEVARDFADGPRRGQRVLALEEDRAFALVGSLTPVQRKAAIVAEQPYGDILTRNAAKLQRPRAEGVRWRELDRAQQAQLLRLVDAFADLVEPALAAQRLARVRTGGFESIRFAWIGARVRRRPYYYRIQGRRFLIELDNSGGNHIHSVWRDFDGDWGRDVLGEHYRGAAGTDHRH